MMKINRVIFPINNIKTFELSTKISETENQNIDQFLFSLFNLMFEVLSFPQTELNFDVQFFNSGGNEESGPGDFFKIQNKTNYSLREELSDGNGNSSVDEIVQLLEKQTGAVLRQ